VTADNAGRRDVLASRKLRRRRERFALSRLLAVEAVNYHGAFVGPGAAVVAADASFPFARTAGEHAMRTARLLAVACVLALAAHAPARAQENSAEAKEAEKALAAKGLKRSGTNLLLTEEAELSKMLAAAPKLKKSVLDTDKVLAGFEKKAADNKKLITTYIQERRKLNAAISGGKLNFDQQTKAIAAYNELGDRIDLLIENGGMEKEIKAARAEQTKAREAYIDHVLAMQKLADKGQKKLADLAEDAAVRAAVERLSKATGKTFAVKESGSWQAAVRSLKRLEDSVLSDQIDLRDDGSSTLLVSVSLNGKYVKELYVDSGSSLISLPYKMARDVGLNPDSSTDEVTLVLADGRTVRGKRLTLSKVRVGKFELDNVACVVMPADLPDATPLLGMSFLSQFSFKIDADQKKLTMTRIEGASAAKTVAKP
jgi:aspartyl protease family protein